MRPTREELTHQLAAHMYQYTESGLIKMDKEGNRQPITNFTAKIITQTKFVDGDHSKTRLQIEGRLRGEELPVISVPYEKFAAMAWPSQAWGTDVIIYPAPNAKDDLRAAIQIVSQGSPTEYVYKSTGWQKMPDGTEAYLTSSGAITPEGLDTSVAVELPPDLAKYSLPAPPDDPRQVANSIRASLSLRHLCPPETSWPLLAATYRAAIGSADYSIHLAGRTGTFKSEISSLFQSHFGGEMDARHLPGSWSGTANSLEALAYRAQHALFVIDDYIPVGTAYQQRALNVTADRLFRAQGNQQGRSRMTDSTELRQTFFPRGLILSTGEDVPKGHSLRGRLLILELQPQTTSPETLTKCQSYREYLPHAMAAFIQWIATRGTEKIKKQVAKSAAETRNRFNGLNCHARTPSALAETQATAELIITFALDKGAINTEEANELYSDVETAIMTTGKNQIEHQQDTDPTDQFFEVLRAILSGNFAHLRSRHGGIPKQPHKCGWKTEQAVGDMPAYKASGPKIGWINWEEDEIYLDDTVAYDTIHRHSRGAITLTKQTLWKRLGESGKLAKRDAQRRRNTIRLTCEGAGRTVVVLSASKALGGEGEDND